LALISHLYDLRYQFPSYCFALVARSGSVASADYLIRRCAASWKQELLHTVHFQYPQWHAFAFGGFEIFKWFDTIGKYLVHKLIHNKPVEEVRATFALLPLLLPTNFSFAAPNTDRTTL